MPRTYTKRTPQQQARVNENVRYHRYGITANEYLTKLTAQNELCACCGGIEPIIDPRTGLRRTLSVDHNHGTGVNNELLCSSCNISLGHMQHETNRIKMLLNYCIKHYGE